MDDRHIPIAAIVLILSTVTTALYLISDYYMDDGWPSSFGQICGHTVGDDCAYINSHLNTFGIAKYDSDISCTMMLDAGKQKDARYKLKWKRFDLEESVNCTADSLTIYDSNFNNLTNTEPFGTFCGSDDPNTTHFPSQRYVTLKFHTDGGTNKKGFRILATRTVPYPCPGDDYFHCKSENRCIDGRLKCDGTVQCDDETDEDDCSFWEKLIGGLLALGVAGLVGIFGMCLSVCIGIGVIICSCTCCRKQCGCLYRCCKNNCCEPMKEKLATMKKGKVGATNNTSIVAVYDTDDETLETDDSESKGGGRTVDNGSMTPGVNKILSKENTISPRDPVVSLVQPDRVNKTLDSDWSDEQGNDANQSIGNQFGNEAARNNREMSTLSGRGKTVLGMDMHTDNGMGVTQADTK